MAQTSPFLGKTSIRSVFSGRREPLEALPKTKFRRLLVLELKRILGAF